MTIAAVVLKIKCIIKASTWDFATSIEQGQEGCTCISLKYNFGCLQLCS